ncbi:MAG: DUF4442 domain-containing protein [Candidatus Marinimicrobia bacterium]|jgi:hypothetical protein|nr:DUF4442 domain-containing protein [Candidatus Neomarinimicrobiota bacterium]MBT5747990.1 DUF4442 domain-containing protein [Candidatus Neomarinimicrobiota bacterium]MBT6866111.1 DUF4442 domain-containing protein [Candidatus Neomarinimicrobiota bacterium]MBT7043117.1 DUF4442 domain-containing protein [Candidatus Neomarinimicrobiota bacterium]
MNETQKNTCKKMTNWFWFKLYALGKLPLPLFTGIKITELNEEKCVTSVKYKWLNKNPFRSTYWAVLGMAAELSSGAYALLATQGKSESVAVILVSTKAEFLKKATGTSTFTCMDWTKLETVANRAIESNEPQIVLCETVGIDDKGEPIARFEFTWSFKKREHAIT